MKETEIQLGDYFQLLIKHRAVVWKLVAAVLLVILIILAVGPKRYRIISHFRIGKVANYFLDGDGLRFIEEPDSLRERLESIYGLEEVKSLAPAPVVQIEFKGFNRQRLSQKVNQIKAELLREHQDEYGKHEKQRELIFSMLNARIAQLEKEISTMESARQPGGGNPLWNLDANGQSVLLQRKDELWQQKTRASKLESLIQNQIIYPSEFIETVNNPEFDWAWPASLLVVGVVLALGLIIGVIVVREIKNPQE